MENTDTKKFNITVLEIYYIIMLIFKLLDYEIVFSNKTIGWICAIIIHFTIVCISFKKINHDNLTRFLVLGLILYIVNAIEETNIFYNFMLLITNIIIYYSKRSKDVKKDRKIIVIILMIFVFINLVRFYFMFLFNIGDMVVSNTSHNKYYYKAISSDSKYEVCIEEIPTGAGSSFRHDINLKENIFNFGTIKIQRIKHCSTLASVSGEIIVKWEDNQKFSLWEKSVGEGRISFEYICEYTIDSFINSDTFINARNEEFREKMRKLKTVEDLNRDEREKLKTVEDLNYEDNDVKENSLEEEKYIDIKY